jgi:DNA-binding HxlR family transcriptional regulator
MLIPDNSFKNIIFLELEKGDKSISSLHRVLTTEGHKVHRLVLTGYLKAMEEIGLLSSRDFPPSKVYSISSSAEKDIYETVKEVCANIDEIPDKKRPEIILYFLQKLFRRPVFQEEMIRAGFDVDLESFAVKISNEERLEIKKQLTRKGYKLPLKDPAFIIQDKTYDKEFDLLIQHMLLQKFKAMNLSVDSKQTKLGI